MSVPETKTSSSETEAAVIYRLRNRTIVSSETLFPSLHPYPADPKAYFESRQKIDTEKSNSNVITGADIRKLCTFTFYASDFKNDKITFKDPGGSFKDGAVLQWRSPKVPGDYDSFTSVVKQECNLKLIEAKARPAYFEFWNPEWLKRPNVAVILYAWSFDEDIFVDCYYHAKDNEFVVGLAKGLDHKLGMDEFKFLEGQLFGYHRPFRVYDENAINDYLIKWIVTEKEEDVVINVEAVRIGEKPVPTVELDAQLVRWNAALYPRVCRYYIEPWQVEEQKDYEF
jgi:hypothetical protein